MPEDSGADKTEDPTPKKRQDARDEGQVAYSPEVNTVGVLLAGFLALGLLGSWFWGAAGVAVRRACSDQLTVELDGGRALADLFAGYVPLVGVLAVFLAIILVAALILAFAQVGFHPTLKPLIPKANRISPVTGFKRLFGLRGLVRTGVAAAKLSLVVFVAWQAIEADLPKQMMVDGRIAWRLAAECRDLYALGLKLVLLLALIAAIDYAYQRWQHTRDLRMTKQEVKEEYKQSEGDPLVKGKIRQIQRQMAQRRMMQEVPKADVVITNPTHVAVALKYDKDSMAAPEVVAKGYDGVAQRIKAIAAENRIPMVENVPLARALAKEVEIGRAIPTKWYQAVAEVLAAVWKLKKAA